MKRSTKSDFFFRCPFEDSTFGHIFWEPPFYVVRRLPVAIHYPGHSRVFPTAPRFLGIADLGLLLGTVMARGTESSA